MSNELRTYRLVAKITTNGLGSLNFYSDPFRTYSSPRDVLRNQLYAEVPVDNIEEFINGHWW